MDRQQEHFRPPTAQAGRARRTRNRHEHSQNQAGPGGRAGGAPWEKTFKTLLPAASVITQSGGWDRGDQFLPNRNPCYWALWHFRSSRRLSHNPKLHSQDITPKDLSYKHSELIWKRSERAAPGAETQKLSQWENQTWPNHLCNPLPHCVSRQAPGWAMGGDEEVCLGSECPIEEGGGPGWWATPQRWS